MSGLMMDAAGYQTCFTKEQLALLCANYDGRIDSLGAENAKLRELMAEMWRELDALTKHDAGGGRGVVCEFATSMRELGIEVGE